MPTYIIKHTMPDGEDRYLVWSTIVDAPLTVGVTFDELREYWNDVYVRERGWMDFDRRIREGIESLADVASCNRAGAGETRLSIEQIVDYYFVRKGEGERPVGAAEYCSQCGAQVEGFHACEGVPE